MWNIRRHMMLSLSFTIRASTDCAINVVLLSQIHHCQISIKDCEESKSATIATISLLNWPKCCRFWRTFPITRNSERKKLHFICRIRLQEKIGWAMSKDDVKAKVIYATVLVETKNNLEASKSTSLGSIKRQTKKRR
ncbi:hypothetical protein M8C21_033755 [Ambrosia artemisiifolia]|uniref:Secreted protein n=1 Tax=Ambrosia artemisiifolia TaxID=4212 RepID=A0AAD5GS04_AMBAR|nr:hypothetical protein M8C21_033755 [Ambrosia artemisiifolia]